MDIDLTPKVISKVVNFKIGEQFRLKGIIFKIIKTAEDKIILSAEMATCELCKTKFYIRKRGQTRFCNIKCNWAYNARKRRGTLNNIPKKGRPRIYFT